MDAVSHQIVRHYGRAGWFLCAKCNDDFFFFNLSHYHIRVVIGHWISLPSVLLSWAGVEVLVINANRFRLFFHPKQTYLLQCASSKRRWDETQMPRALLTSHTSRRAVLVLMVAGIRCRALCPCSVFVSSRPCSWWLYDNDPAALSTADSSGVLPRPFHRLRVARGDQ